MNGLPTAGVALADTYREFALLEAAGNCAIYERLCLGVAQHGRLLELLEQLPRPKRQPNLLLAAGRWHGAPMESTSDYLEWTVENWEAVSATMLARRTQTNEAARMDTLEPILRRLPQPLALLEVGASAGLCLYPRDAGIRVAWRGGIDLNPLSVDDPGDMRWLECLVWPSQPHRLARLREAVAVARQDPPTLVRGDLTTDLDELISRVPDTATLVVFHTAVLAYVDGPGREAFTVRMATLDGHWLSNEAPGLLHTAPGTPQGKLLLAMNGVPVAFTGPHGQSFQWIDPYGTAPLPARG